MDEKQISQLVKELDALVPREAAAVQVQFDDEGGTIYANRNGYLRLGIELLRSVTMAEAGKTKRLEVDWIYLLAKDSDQADYTPLLVDELPKRAIPTKEQGRDVGWLIFGLIILLVFSASVGAVAIIRWIW